MKKIISIAIILTIFIIGTALILNNTDSPSTSDNPKNNLTFEGGIGNMNNQLTIDLYTKYKSEEGNMFFSPYSIFSALAMTYEGAKDQTAIEMQNVLHVPQDKEELKNKFLSAYNALNKEGKSYKLNTANALWAQEDYPFLENYLNTINTYYGGKVTNMDFKNNPEDSRIEINNWIEEQTNNKIKNLVPGSAITPLTRLILTNAIYFKGNWSKQFKEEATQNKEFVLNSGQIEQVKMMRQTGFFNYGETKDLQILEMFYTNDDLSMIIILPKNNDLERLESNLNIKNLNNWQKEMQKERVRISLPKFKFETKYFMAKNLIEMGMPLAFSDGADFSGMTGKKDLAISEVIHQTFINVSESGTEAAAATAIVMIESAGPSAPKEPKIFNVDHPFIFLIQDKTTETILFVGRVKNPNK